MGIANSASDSAFQVAITWCLKPGPYGLHAFTLYTTTLPGTLVRQPSGTNYVTWAVRQPKPHTAELFILPHNNR